MFRKILCFIGWHSYRATLEDFIKTLDYGQMAEISKVFEEIKDK